MAFHSLESEIFPAALVAACCMALKTLNLTPGTNLLDLDDCIVEFAAALVQSLEHFTLGFDNAPPSAVYKLLDALATKNLKRLSLAARDPLILNDPTAMERFVAGNQNLELFGVRNFPLVRMTGIFGAMADHDSLKEIGIYNTLKSAHNARTLGRLLSQNRIPLELGG